MALLVVAFAAVALRAGETDDQSARSVQVPAPPEIAWTPQPGVAGMQSLAGGPGGTVAVGAEANQAKIWFSVDGKTWSSVYTHPAGVSSSCPRCLAALTTSSFTAVKYLAGRWIAFGTEGQPGRALVISSTDGQTWTPADPAAFMPTTNKPVNGVASMVRDVTRGRGRYVAVGDTFTANPRQNSGQSPTIWTSRDAVHWRRQTTHLGNGFDPYQVSIVWRHGRYVATGQMGRFPAVAWTSTDLRHWEAHPITGPVATANIAATSHGYIAFGAIENRDPTHRKARPAIWHSSDGEHWRQTLVLPRASSGGFTAIGEVGGAVVAIGATTDGPASTFATPGTTLVYLSSHGIIWSAAPTSALGTAAQIQGSGTLGSRFAVITLPGGPSVATPTIWVAVATPARR